MMHQLGHTLITTRPVSPQEPSFHHQGSTSRPLKLAAEERKQVHTTQRYKYIIICQSLHQIHSV